MNQIYRLVWSQVNHAWVAVAENARGHGKSISARKLVAAAAALMGGSLLASSAYAADAANATVVGGTGSVSQAGTTTTINQSSQRLAIDWTSLSTAVNEALVFRQPNASAIALNRITGSSPSTLLGSLTANGQVYILNPNGVLFGAGAQVNVGGLVASTLTMNPSDFMNGSSTFTKDPNASGSVVNQGTLTASDGGYIALLSGTVRNEGTINAPLGTALLAAGDKVTLNVNNGSLIGYTIGQGDLNALVENKQLIRADGGQVIMVAKALDQLSTAVINNTGVVEARTVQNKNGHILLLGDMDVGTVNVGGTLDASAASSGNGGTIETSAAHVKVADGTKVTTAAAQGLTGSWLIDPADFTVAASGGDMTGATLSTSLGTTSVQLLSTNGATSGSGDININDTVSWNAATTLTLSAQRNININNSITAADASGKVALQYGLNAVNAGNTATYNVNAQINLQAGDNFSTQLGSNGATIRYKVITGLGSAGSTTGTDLQGISGNTSGNYVLGSNVDASATTSWNSGAGFVPIQSYSGTFDGLGHTISNLTINLPATNKVGLFGVASTSSTIKNVGLVGSSVSGWFYVGGLIGINYGTVSNSYATGSVSGTNHVGGLVGINSGTVGNSYATGSVSGWFYVGGLIGINYGTVSNSYATGSVSGSDYVGGLVGANYGTVSNSYATGSVIGSNSVGGLIGFNNGTVSNSYWNTTTSGQTSSSGGTGLTTTEMQTASNFVGFNFTTTPGAAGNAWVMVDADGTLNNAGGTLGATFPMLASEYSTTITNAHQLQLIAMAPGASYTLSTNINAAGTAGSGDVWNSTEGFVPIGTNSSRFSGALNGLGHTISNLTINRPSTDAVGLFGYTSSGSVIENVGLIGVSVTGLNYVGGLIGINYGTVSNSYATGSVIGWRYVGGLVGNNNGGTVSNSYATDSVIGTSNVGGLIGVNYGTVSNSYATGSVTGNVYVGGLVGMNNGGTASNSYATGSVTGSKSVGGLIGSNNYGIVNNSYATGSASASYGFAGGLIGANYGTVSNSYATGGVTGWSYVGGLVGVNGGTVSNSYATGSVTGTGHYVGGLIGINVGTAGNSYATGSVTGSSYVGGLVGYNYSGTVSTSYATGSVTGTSNVGGLVGKNNSAITASFWNTASSGISIGVGSGSSSGVTGIDNTAASELATFTNAGWSIGATGGTSTIWRIYEGETGPLLRSFLTAITVTADATSKTYDGATSTASTYSTSINGAALNGSLNYVSSKNAGAYSTASSTLTQTGLYSGQQGYDISYANASLTINKANVTLSTSDVTKTYDGTTAAAGTAVATAGAIFTGDSISGGSFAFADKNAGTSDKTVTTSGVTVGDGVNNSNYNVSYAANTTSTINKANVTLSTSDVTKTYDGTTAASGTVVATVGTIFTGDSLSGGTFAYADKNAGTANKTVTASGVTISDGNSGNNYNVTYASNTSSTINKANLILSAADVTKTYDGTTSAVGSAVAASGTQVFSGDSISGGSFAFADKNAGTSDKTVTISGVTVSDGNSGNNYNVSYANNTTSTINKANLTVTASAVTKTYDGSTSATGTGTVGTLAGAAAGETINANGSEAFADKNAGSNKTVVASGVTVQDSSNADVSGNYNIVYVANTTSTISKANLIATAAGVNKVYDGLSNATVTYTDNRIAGDILNFSNTASFADKNAGNGKAVTVSSIVLNGADAGNYNLTTTTGSTSANITPASLTVTANSSSKFYDGLAYTGNSGFTISGLVNGETVADLLGSLGYGGSSQGAIGIGDYAIAPGGLSSANYTMRFVNGALAIKALSQTSAALGGTALEQSYNAARQSVAINANSGGSSGNDGGNGNNNGDSNNNNSNGGVVQITPRLSMIVSSKD